MLAKTLAHKSVKKFAKTEIFLECRASKNKIFVIFYIDHPDTSRCINFAL